MPTETIELTGSGATGIAPAIQGLLTAPMPRVVKLGRRRGMGALAPRLESYVDPGLMTTPPPTSINRRANAAKSIARMYLNDTYGDCVIAGKMHALGLWSGNDSDSAGIVLATDQEVYSQYVGICGPGDNGCYIPDVLDAMKSKGLVAGGKAYKIDGYVSADWTNKLLVQVAQYVFGATTIGINLPAAWTSNAVWDVTNTGIVGGHDVTPIDYDDQGVYVASWGRIYLITWRAFLSKTWLEEYYVLLSPLWYGSDKLAPCGINAAALLSDLQTIGNGGIPPIDPTPVPVVPPVVPPAPPVVPPVPVPVPPVPVVPPPPPIPVPPTPVPAGVNFDLNLKVRDGLITSIVMPTPTDL